MLATRAQANWRRVRSHITTERIVENKNNTGYQSVVKATETWRVDFITDSNEAEAITANPKLTRINRVINSDFAYQGNNRIRTSGSLGEKASILWAAVGIGISNALRPAGLEFLADFDLVLANFQANLLRIREATQKLISSV